ncbi:hypothetical protein Glove_276g102 [Diversispora epigaea]|uniref:Uncharacterized protein n=1 Tax=Diversispora epigaea TaxID=1348612 RepID=A0A397I9Y8_9GLOM|nr:hypothetical protein Glove_276g102 [Diversispora epigaea]
MNQKITFATILVAFSVFFICFTNASPIELSPRAPGSVCYADFKRAISGRITATELWGKTLRITGQLNTGFPNRICKYEFQVTGHPKKPVPSNIIFPPGTAPFQFDLTNEGIENVAGKTVTFFCSGKFIDSARFVLV